MRSAISKYFQKLYWARRQGKPAPAASPRMRKHFSKIGSIMSEKKLESVRKNGKQPVKSSSRARGRPRKCPVCETPMIKKEDFETCPGCGEYNRNFPPK